MDTLPEAREAVALMGDYSQEHRFRARHWSSISVGGNCDKGFGVVIGLETDRSLERRTEQIQRVAENLGVLELVSQVRVSVDGRANVDIAL